MFLVGEYAEDEAKSVAGYLKDAGFKVDMRGLVQARTDYTATLQGRCSEMKEKVDSVILERYERFLEALKAAVEKGATEETFRDLFLNEVNPGWKERMEKFEVLDDQPEDPDEEERREIIRSMADCIASLVFATDVLEINGIKLEEPLAGRLDDPVISIPVDPYDYEPDDPMLRQRMDVDLVKRYEITIDEFSAPLLRQIDEEFKDEYMDEYLKIQALGIIMEDLIDEPEKGKIDIEDFAERCMIDVGDRDIMSVDASLVAEEIARSLEKNGIIKMKGNTIKWKA